MNLYISEDEAEVLLQLLDKVMNTNELDAYWDWYNLSTRIRQTQKENA